MKDKINAVTKFVKKNKGTIVIAIVALIIGKIGYDILSDKGLDENGEPYYKNFSLV